MPWGFDAKLALENGAAPVDVFDNHVAGLACGRVVEGSNETHIVNGDGKGNGLERCLVAVLFAEPFGEVDIGLKSYKVKP